MSTPVRIEGELYLLVEDAAACFEVEVHWVEELCAVGALDAPRREADRLLVPARELDRLAVLVRLVRVHGVELDVALLWLS